VAFLLGVFGIREQQFAAGRTISWADAIYFSLRLFTFSFDLQDQAGPYAPSPALLSAARFLAPLPLAYAGLKALFLLARQRLGLWRIRAWRGHAVVFGAGQRGRMVALNLRREGHRVAVVERDPGNAALSELRDAGVEVVVGNAADPLCHRQARIGHAGLVLAVTASEEANLEVALAAARRTEVGPVVIQAHVTRAFAEAFESHPPFDRIRNGVHARFFDHGAAAARLLFQEFGPCLVPPPDAGSGRAPRFLLLGDGEVLGELVRTIVIQAHFPGMAPPAVRVVGPADRSLGGFHARHPQLELVCGLRRTVLAEPGVTATWLEAAREEPDPDLVFIACEQDAATLALARDLVRERPSLRGRIVACLRPSSNMLALLNVAEPVPGVVFRDLVALGCRPGVLLQGELDRDARAIHERYVAKEVAAGRDAGSTPSLMDWDDLPESLRQANRAQADHFAIKAATLRRGLDDATLEALTEAEHRRWMAEKIVAGWRHGPVRDDARKLHPSLQAYAGLSEAEQRKDRDAVLTVARGLAREAAAAKAQP
jgi:hypothetical protein